MVQPVPGEVPQVRNPNRFWRMETVYPTFEVVRVDAETNTCE
jgi:hypothetical protein